MPYWVTIVRAISVTRSMSFDRAGGDLVEDDLLGCVATQREGQVVLELALGPHVAVLAGQHSRVAAHHAAGDDADLVHRVHVGEHAGDEGVADLVIGGDRLLALGDDAALALGAGDHAVDGLFELVHADGLAVAPRGEDRGLVDQVLQVGAREAGGLLGQGLQEHALLQRLAAAVDLQDGHAALDVGAVEHDLAVEAAGAQQRRVEHVGAVGGGDRR